METKAEKCLDSSADVASTFNEDESKGKFLLEPNKDSGKCSASSGPQLEEKDENQATEAKVKGDKDDNPLQTESDKDELKAKEEKTYEDLSSEYRRWPPPPPPPVRRIRSSLKCSSLPVELSGVPSSFNHGVGSSSSWPLELKEEEILIVRVKTLQNNCDGEKDERIPKHEAVCKFCFDTFGNGNILKTICKCKFTLIHEDCAIEWSRERGNNKCKLCDQDIQNIPVTLSMADEPNAENPNSHPKRKRSTNWFGCFGDKV